MGRKQFAYVNKEMLKWARSETPFADSPADVSARFPRIDSEELARWESGEELPSIREAKDLAKIYKLPFACFFLSEVPAKKPKKYTDRRTILGTEYGAMSYELWEEINRINDDRLTLLEYLDEESYTIQDLPAIEASDSIETIASILRSYLNIPVSFKYKKDYGNNPFNYFREKLEDRNIIVAQVAGVDLLEMKGLSIYEENFPIVAINSKDFDRAKVFSLFHEVAHLIRRSSSLCLIDDNERNDAEEKMCDSIAAEILMERKEFSRIANDILSQELEWSPISLQRLADRFGVSIVSAFRRLHDLHIITDRFYYDYYKTINEEFEKKKNEIEAARAEKNVPFFFHVKYINRHGHLMPKMVVLAHGSGSISLGEACKVMNIKSKYFSAIARAVMV